MTKKDYFSIIDAPGSYGVVFDNLRASCTTPYCGRVVCRFARRARRGLVIRLGR